VKRLFWALVGIGLGAVVGAQVVRWAGKTKQRYSPPNLAREAGGKVASLADRLKEAVAAGLEEMTHAEAEIRADLGLPLN
jgi:hypothetical protein